MLFESLPVELIADILGELTLNDLIKLSQLSRRLHRIASDPSLNPWRRPILRTLHTGVYEDALKHLSVRSTVPRQNWIEILSLARPSFILYDATLPNLTMAEWEECFDRRFLPGWRKWRKDGSWKEAFMKMLYRTWHRSATSCTSDEAWTKYIVLNRNGSANELEISSRNFNPLILFNEMKLQSSLTHLETRVRLVLQLADVRILAFGTLERRRNTLSANPNAHTFLHPPGIVTDAEVQIADKQASSGLSSHIVDHGVYPMQSGPTSPRRPRHNRAYTNYARLVHPLPSLIHWNYPRYTPGGGDKRWLDSDEEDFQWVGGVMITAQIIGPHIHESPSHRPPLQDMALVSEAGRQQYASFTWSDLWCIAPWMEERITRKIDGPGLGIL
ncbi:hypothetical protein BD779DRAFT_1492615 [Infundibulicybe gibba]|nr:hypothetical protein BD779DRAFT_1492615 [Infundibulicybe gibba]